jgi:hypothetical protein
MNFEERLSRNAPEDAIYMGETVEKALSGEFGLLLKAIIEAAKDDYLYTSEKNPLIPADRTLGRIEALNAIQLRLDQCVSVSRSLKDEIKEEKRN